MNCLAGQILSLYGSCIYCPLNCKSCLTGEKCLICEDGFKLDNNTSKCIQKTCDANQTLYGDICIPLCTSVEYLDKSSLTYKKCEAPCMGCINQTACRSCPNGTFFDYKNLNCLSKNCK